MICPMCGNENPDGSVLCAGCGTSLVQSAVNAFAPDDTMVQGGMGSIAAPKKSKKGLFIGIGVAAVAVIVAVVLLCVFLLGGNADGTYVASEEGASYSIKIDGNKFEMSVEYLGQKITVAEGKCKISGSKMTLTCEGEDLEAKYNSSKKTITIEDDDMKLVFKKK